MTKTRPIARKTALFNNNLPSVRSGPIEAREEVVHVGRQCRCMRDLVLCRADELGQVRGHRPIDVLPRPAVWVVEVTRDGADSK